MTAPQNPSSPKPSWEQHYASLQAFKAEHGDCGVPLGYLSPDGIPLGRWLRDQKAQARERQYPAEKRERLDDIGVALPSPLSGIWTTHEDCGMRHPEESDLVGGETDNGPRRAEADFQLHLVALERFKAAHGHCFAPAALLSADGLHLGRWLTELRTKASKGGLSDEERAQLDAMGVDLRQLPEDDERCFSAFVEFQMRNGHFNVPDGFITQDGLHLGLWYERVRDHSWYSTKASKQADDLVRERLESLGLITANEEFFAQWAALREQQGVVSISPTHGGLYAWAQARRHEAQHGVSSPAELARLANAGVLEESPLPERQRN